MSLTVFRLGPAPSARALACRREGAYARVYDLRASRVEADRWDALEFIRDGSAGDGESDVLLLGTEPAFTARAVEALQDVLYLYGQILPLRSRDGEFYLWNVTNVVDALDEERSRLTRFASSGRVMSVERWAFRPAALGAGAAFKVPQFRRAYTFITEAFANRAGAAGLLGFAPEEAWRTDVGAPAG